MQKPTEYTLEVIQTIKKIPRGKVATYKQIASLTSKPGAIRAVVWILHSCSKAHKLPWHRVLNAKGRIAFDRRASHFRQQKRLLEREGVVLDEEGQLSLPKYQWKKNRVRVSFAGTRHLCLDSYCRRRITFTRIALDISRITSTVPKSRSRTFNTSRVGTGLRGNSFF